ncbi:MAG: hypothetical protein V4597_08355 [Pseudomonadota bacterium]
MGLVAWWRARAALRRLEAREAAERRDHLMAQRWTVRVLLLDGTELRETFGPLGRPFDGGPGVILPWIPAEARARWRAEEIAAGGIWADAGRLVPPSRIRDIAIIQGLIR